jgi:hypothetical protein
MLMAMEKHRITIDRNTCPMFTTTLSKVNLKSTSCRSATKINIIENSEILNKDNLL